MMRPPMERTGRSHGRAFLAASACEGRKVRQAGVEGKAWRRGGRPEGQAGALPCYDAGMRINWIEVCKFLAGAFFVNAGILFYLYLTDTSIPVLGTHFVVTPEMSGLRS